MHVDGDSEAIEGKFNKKLTDSSLFCIEIL